MGKIFLSQTGQNLCHAHSAEPVGKEANLKCSIPGLSAPFTEDTENKT